MHLTLCQNQYKSLKKSDNNKLDRFQSSTETRSNKIAKLGTEVEKSVIETDIQLHTESTTQDKQSDVKKFPELRRSERIKNRFPVSYNEEIIPDDYILCAQSLVYKTPTSFHEIKNRDDRVEWENAIKDEIDSLLINNTWTLVKKPENRNIVDCKWIFTIKDDEFGNPFKYKARVVARGFSQKYLIDYNETSAPVARISSSRFIISFANQFNLMVHHMDVKSAFLNGILKEEIYMKVPEGIKCKDNEVCKLNKAIYGLKQSAKCWFEIFEETLINKGYRNSSVDR